MSWRRHAGIRGERPAKRVTDVGMLLRLILAILAVERYERQS